MSTPEEKAEQLKAEGNGLLKEKKYEEAVAKYSAAIDLHPTAVFYSNRAAANLKLKAYDAVLADAEAAIVLNPEYFKGHARKIAAHRSKKQHQDVLDACDEAERKCAVESFGKTETKMLLRERTNAWRALLTDKLLGAWHAKVTDPLLGDTTQAFEWVNDKECKATVIGQTLQCGYNIRLDLDNIDGGWRMDLSVPGQNVPYLFKFEDDKLLFVAPVMNPQTGFVEPTSFDPKQSGFVRLSRGEPPVDLSATTMSQDDKVLAVLEELLGSYTKAAEAGPGLSDKEKLVQGIQIMQVRSIQAANKYGKDVFKLAEKIAEDPSLTGNNEQLRKVAQQLHDKIAEVQQVMGTSNSKLASAAAVKTDSSSQPKADAKLVTASESSSLPKMEEQKSNSVQLPELAVEAEIVECSDILSDEAAENIVVAEPLLPLPLDGGGSISNNVSVIDAQVIE